MTSEPSRAGAGRLTGLPVGLTLAAAIGIAILVGLGVWQLQRLKWKQGVLAQVAALQTAPAQPLAPVLERAAKGADVAFTRVSIDCLPFNFRQTRVYLYGVRDSAMQWRPISPCAIDDANFGMIAIDRGVAAGGDMTAPPAVSVSDARHVVGVLRRVEAPGFMQRLAERSGGGGGAAAGYQSRDKALAALEQATGLPAPSWMVVAEHEAPAPAGVTPEPLPPDIPNRHFEYALTWFGLAAALAGVYAAVLFRKARVR
ncbi:MAG TPA: SURF1 family cytochrome oxidase biogenesis protein [Caulobacteraceae bacterium]